MRRSHPRNPSRRWQIAALALLAASAVAAQAPPEQPEVSPELAADAPTFEAPTVEAPAPSGLRAFVDPETGELTSTPTREQVEALSQEMSAHLAAALSRSSDGLEPFELLAGGRGVNLKGRFQSALVVRRLESGGFELVCRDDPPGAEHDHRAAVASPSQWAEK